MPLFFNVSIRQGIRWPVFM